MWEYANLESDVTVNLWEKVAVIQCEYEDIAIIRIPSMII